jgi:hypothetical protein
MFDKFSFKKNHRESFLYDNSVIKVVLFASLIIILSVVFMGIIT